MYENAIKLNYQHILGGFKENQLNEIIQELKYVDEDIYKNTMKHINFLLWKMVFYNERQWTLMFIVFFIKNKYKNQCDKK